MHHHTWSLATTAPDSDDWTVIVYRCGCGEGKRRWLPTSSRLLRIAQRQA